MKRFILGALLALALLILSVPAHAALPPSTAPSNWYSGHIAFDPHKVPGFRSYWIRTTLTKPTVPRPLLIVLPDRGISASQINAQTGIFGLASTRGFDAAIGDEYTPTGFSADGSWNAYPGYCCESDNIDDVGYVQAVIANVKARSHVNPAKVYIIGHGAGGMLGFSVACAGDIAKMVTVNGPLGPQVPCTVGEPFDALHLFGTHDALVPFRGGVGFDLLTFPSIYDEVQIRPRATFSIGAYNAGHELTAAEFARALLFVGLDHPLLLNH